MLWWSKVGYRKKRSCSTEKCLSGSRIPPLRRVRSCSPSASARTVTAHSLKAIGMEKGRGIRVQEKLRRTAPERASRAERGASLHVSRRLPNQSRSDVRMASRQSPAGVALEDLDHRGEVRVAQFPGHRGDQDVARGRGGGEGRAGRLGLLEAQPHVLEHVLELEERRVVVGAHRPGLERE